MKKVLLHTLLLLFVAGTSIYGQENPPFWNEIQAFKKRDSIQPPTQHAILFTGSSSFRMWHNVQQAFPNHTIINRGFGGSSLPDVIRYANDIIFSYQPKQIVLYAGENDLAASDTITAQTVLQRFQQLHGMIRKKLPGVPVVFVSIKPSPSRDHIQPKIKEANRLIERFIKQQPHTTFVDVYHAMLGPDGKPRPELFIEDQLHMNEKGYAIWKQKLQPVLRKN